MCCIFALIASSFHAEKTGSHLHAVFGAEMHLHDPHEVN